MDPPATRAAPLPPAAVPPAPGTGGADDTETVRARGAMDGAATLGEAAAMLRAAAADLEVWEAEGWQLAGPVRDDHGVVRRVA